MGGIRKPELVESSNCIILGDIGVGKFIFKVYQTIKSLKDILINIKDFHTLI